jgi:hypothetical protein
VATEVVARCSMCGEWVCARHARVHPEGFVKPIQRQDAAKEVA